MTGRRVARPGESSARPQQNSRSITICPAPPRVPCRAKNDECTGKNAEQLSLLCPLSCGMCDLTCQDQHNACGDWAKAGHCSSNAAYMIKECPTSCGICSPTCKDVHEDCPGWTRAGACGENPTFMLKNCPVRQWLVLAGTPTDLHPPPPDRCRPLRQRVLAQCCARRPRDARVSPSDTMPTGTTDGAIRAPHSRADPRPRYGPSRSAVARAVPQVACGVCKDECKDTHRDCPGWVATEDGGSGATRPTLATPDSAPQPLGSAATMRPCGFAPRA